MVENPLRSRKSWSHYTIKTGLHLWHAMNSTHIKHTYRDETVSGWPLTYPIQMGSVAAFYTCISKSQGYKDYNYKIS